MFRKSFLKLFKSEPAPITPVIAVEDRDEVLWSYSYPTNNGEVRIRALENFQSGIINLVESTPDKACRDFKRGHKITGVIYTKETKDETILDDIHHLVDDSHGYGDDKNVKKMLSVWLSSRGGQDHNFFIQDLVRDNHFTSDQYIGMASMNQNMIDFNWIMNAEGKLELQLCNDILSLTVKRAGDDESFVIIRKGKDQLELYQQEAPEWYARVREKLSPVIRISAKIQLEIRDGNVIPVFKEIIVNGYTNQLHVHGERFTNKNDPRNKAALGALGLVESLMKDFDNNISAQQELTTIMRIIESSHFADDTKAIELACKYIEKIILCLKGHPIERYIPLVTAIRDSDAFNESSMRLFGRNVLNNLTYENINDALEERNIKTPDIIYRQSSKKSDILCTFGVIYLKLQLLLNEFKPESTYQYPVSQSGSIEGNFIDKWGCILLATNPAPNAAFYDLRRGYQINGAHFNAASNDVEITDAISQMTKCVKNASKDDIAALNDWIATRGGQNNDCFLQLLLNDNEVSINYPEDIRPSVTSCRLFPGNIHIGKSEWSLGADGNISLSYIFYVSTINLYSDKAPLESGSALDIIVTRDINSKRLIFQERKSLSPNHELPAIMRVEAKITLNVAKGKVSPEMKLLKIESFSSDLTPSRLEMKNTNSQPLLIKNNH